MKSFVSISLKSAATALPLFVASLHAQVEHVDPTIGGVGLMLVPTRPLVHMPNSMVRVYPIRKDQLDLKISSFPLSIVSHRLGELFSLMPGENGGPQVWDQETTTPYHYSTLFTDSGIRTEFTTAERAGYFRFTFPDGKATLHLKNILPGALKVEGPAAVSGEERFKGMKAFIYGEFSQPVETAVTPGNMMKLKATASTGTIGFRYGLSFISVDQAKQNLTNEIPQWNFDDVKTAGKARWNQVLGQVAVQGGTEAQKRVFYTSLYRSYERMVNISEDGQYYSAYDHQVHKDERPFYIDNWIWDNFRALQPLHMILDPKMQADQLQSYVRMYQQSGWMPSFSILWGDNPCMNGNHAAAWFADAWHKGIRDFNLPKAYEGLRKNSLEATLLPWRNGPKCALDDFYNTKGYFPSLAEGEKETEPLVHEFENRQAVAVTLGNAYDDWCIAQLAKALDKTDDTQLFLKRAAFYKNVYNPEKGFVWPKDKDGNWLKDFDPEWSGGQGGRAYFAENNAYTYNWDVLHDFHGLIDLMGGPKAAENKLDELFTKQISRSKYEFWAKFPDSTALVGQFVMANEPSFSTPYLYNHVGAPWKSQKILRTLLESFFPDNIHGIPGDEDGGGMTSWVVFSMMGFYPATPGVPVYTLGSPVFDDVSVKLDNAKTFRLTAANNSREDKYIQSVKLNGKPLDRLWFTHEDLADGGHLELEMGKTPNLKLGIANPPPSSLTFDPGSLSTSP
jgi:predicted alpha-1,2-mannosidase